MSRLRRRDPALFIRTADGKKHDLWFDNMRKPLFNGRELPWCPDWPCAGWPSALVVNRTRVRVYMSATRPPTLNGKTMQTPTRVVILH